MTREASVPGAREDALTAALLARKVAMHRANLLTTHVGSLIAALTLAAMLFGAVPTRGLALWLGLLGAVFVVRMAIGRFPPRRRSDNDSELALNRALLLRWRLGLLAHGTAWGLCVLLPLGASDPLHLALLTLVMSGVMMCSFALTAFDLPAALLFGAPICGLLSLRLFTQPEPAYWLLGVTVLSMLLILSLAARRNHRVVREYETLRVAEAAQAEALRSGQAELRALLDAFPGYIAVMGPDQTYTYANDRVAALFDQPRASLIGRPVRAVLGDAGLERMLGLTAQLAPDEQTTLETVYPANAQHAELWLQVTYAIGSPGRDGRRNTYAFGIDISARKAAELALTAAKDVAERANRAKSQFLSSMSHELRTPMNAILGFGQLLAAAPPQALALAQREQVGEILQGGRHLLNLINEVLDLAQIETGKLRIFPEVVPIAPLLQECLSMLQPLAHDSRIALDLDVEAGVADALVRADRTRLKQVCLNLLSNAIKYNRSGGKVRIACTGDAATLRIAIRDTGPGLSAEQRARLFHAFERLEAGGTPVEGAGLGLVLSKHLIDAMQGEIGLESETGQGSTFWIRLPRATSLGFGVGAGLPTGITVPGALHETGLRRVLYIEDNPVNLLLMEAMLARIGGLYVSTAELPALGLQMAIDERPDLILLDIQLPDMDGYEVLRRLREHDATRKIPVIAVSANAMPSDVEQGLAAGFAHYVTKPLEMRRLSVAVRQVLADAAVAR
ncbi:MAG TPA: ATP-binding protein [Burkholderiaceae bacterium]